MKKLICMAVLLAALACPAQNNVSVRANTNGVLLYPTASVFFGTNRAAFLSLFSFATNTFAGITAALHYTPATNSYAGIAAALGNFFPATNTYAGISAALGNFFPATNTSAGIVAALGYGPTQLGGTNRWTGTNNLASLYNVVTAKVYTNTGLGDLGLNLVWIATNNATGAAPTTTAPNGSILTSTNGMMWVMSNSIWMQH